MQSMPAYDFECPRHGVFEVVRKISDAHATVLCPHSEKNPWWAIFGLPVRECLLPCHQSFEHRNFYARVAAQEDAGSERTDHTRHLNIGLPDKKIELGKDSKTGKMRYGWRPYNREERSTRQKVQDIAKEHGLSLADGGRYRTLPTSGAKA